ncbi:MAG: S-methyl-5'-thioinosine phosphorylase [Gammaproteobacteria bacterium]|jgi:purine nucleoside phosphorylase|nr:5'-methylthioadenosine phosphorylase [Chromatiales bacterium]MDP6674569.1 S-methyl-5'-thioinosine phosphorylase [Gammaproteobacteria bacterium]
MTKIAVIAGTGSGLLFETLQWTGSPEETPFGCPSTTINRVEQDAYPADISVLARHGPDGSIPPHQINYRANLWSLMQFQPDLIVALNTVGGIHEAAAPATLYFPDQLIDYTWGREQTYSDGKLAPLQHIDFTEPFDQTGRQHLIDRAAELGLDFKPTGTYGVTQGPRLETAAEIDRMERDGCDIVGMTAMPEAALARELGLAYVVCAIVVNRAAGRCPPGSVIHADIQQSTERGMAQVGQLLRSL